MRIRGTLVRVHRWFGLAIALFLVIAGLTGAVISWDHELDEWLNPELFQTDGRGTPLSPLSLAQHVESGDARARVTYLPLVSEPHKAISLFVEPRVNPVSGELFDLGYNQVFLNPATGDELGRREWGKPGVDRAHLVPFLYALHYSLTVPKMWGSDRWGIWLMGIVALVWMVDSFVGLGLTFPGRPVRSARETMSWWQQWKPAWLINLRAGAYRINFDVHRAFGLWFWGLLLILAVSAASLNLYNEVAKPVVTFFSSFTPSPYDLRSPRPETSPIEPALGFADVVKRAEDEAARRAWREPAGDTGYSPEFGLYFVRFFAPGAGHGTAGVGPPTLYFDGIDGRLLGDWIPWRGTAGDLFLQVQFPVHSGRILGLPGRILISITGIAVAALSITGVVIWWRKRRGRVLAAGRVRLRTKPQQTEAALAPLGHPMSAKSVREQ